MGKTELQDNWVIGDANRVYLCRSLRRMERATRTSCATVALYTAYSWEYQQNFGGRIVPSKRVASMVGVPMSQALPPSGGVAPDDVDAQEILAFAKSYAGKERRPKTGRETVGRDKKKDYMQEDS